jgi:hypothetical protein
LIEEADLLLVRSWKILASDFEFGGEGSLFILIATAFFV